MADRLRFLPAGEDGLLIELADLDTALALHDRLGAAPPDGVRDMIMGARTLLVTFDLYHTTGTALAAHIAGLDLSVRRERQGRTVEIPVSYDGEDIEEVARHLGWTVPELIRRHGAATYTVAFTGFAPGFAYLTCDDPAIEVPRRKSPRARIPAGSVALGGRFGGIYPADSPGGWQLIGRTRLRMWDTRRTPAALLSPGDVVRFREAGPQDEASPVDDAPEVAPPPADPARGLLVTRADLPALFQDLGRPGQASQGLSISGALDRRGLIEANLAVGNPKGAAALEIAYGGFALRAGLPVTLALAGAPAAVRITTADGRKLAAPHGAPFALDAGDAVSIGTPASGTRSYLAVRGGFAVSKVIGSAASDTLAMVGPAPVTAGDVLMPGEEVLTAVDPVPAAPRALPEASGTVVLDVVQGPRADWFTPEALQLFEAQAWEVTGETSRVGARLRGAEPLTRAITGELPSEGTRRGAIQVPHSGQPVLFLADHPVTGGYPVIAVLAGHHVDLAGQVPIGAKIRFRILPGFTPSTRETVT